MRADSFRLAVCLQVLLTAEVLEMRVEDGEVGCEHGCRDLVAVVTVTDEGVN